MRVGRLWLADFRNYRVADVALASGLTLVVGGNGEGKTNLLEAVAYLTTLSSFRRAPREALVRSGCPQAVVRAEAERDGRSLLIEAEIRVSGADRVLVNRQPLRRARDLLGALRASVFSPDDLALVKGGPAERRQYLDDTLVAVHHGHDLLRSQVERILRQRNALLRQSSGRLPPDVEATLDVWDAKLAETGEALATARETLVARLEPAMVKAYGQVADAPAVAGAGYERSWEGSLAEAVRAARAEDLRRGTTTVGPHRDELDLVVDGLPARTQASQGEQRSLALALRLAAHALVAEASESQPVLLLDDVFSELDGARAEALVAHLPSAQCILTTAGAVPPGARPELVLRVHGGTVG